MARQLIKGNEAVIKAAILAGCTSYYGYPITPASEVAEAASLYFPRCGGTFIQAESEVAAINMCYGAAAAGERTMSGSCGPGISLMQEGFSYSACAELPMVVVDVARAGPGLGNLGPEQGDYNQVVKGGGHGNYKLIVLAPASCQEMCDLTILAFELADRYRNPALILTEGFCGQMMEPVEFPRERLVAPKKSEWAVEGTAEAALIAHYGSELAAQILVAPHHGHRDLSLPAFIDAVAPRYVLFSTGYKNRFGYPKPETVARYSHNGAIVMDTAQHGAIVFYVDGSSTALQPESYREWARRYWNTP